MAQIVLFAAYCIFSDPEARKELKSKRNGINFRGCGFFLRKEWVYI